METMLGLNMLLPIYIVDMLLQMVGQLLLSLVVLGNYLTLGSREAFLLKDYHKRFFKASLNLKASN
jgi:hypothetical protein